MDSSDSGDLLSSIDDTFFDELTHPVTKDFDHKTWNAFANDLTTACASIFPPNPTQYHKVYALLLNWAVDDLGTDVELQDLGRQLRSQFNFTTDFWKIPSQDSENELEKKLSRVKGELEGEGNLLIVYYGGHGKRDPRNRSIWAAWTLTIESNRQNWSPTLNWSELQPMLKRASCDILIVLDCCFAGSAGRSNVKGTKELLAACGMDVIAEDVTKYSFTRNLIDKLRSFGTRPFTVSELYERLIKAKRRLRNTPQYVPLTGRDRPSIRIARLEPTVPMIMTNESLLCTPQSSPSPSDDVLSSITSTPLTSSQSSFNTTYRVLLAISLESDSTVPQLESWKRWLSSDAPIGIQKIDVRIEDAYPSRSTLVFISMPASVWCHLPDTTAYRFVDFITGESLFKEVPHSHSLEDVIHQKSQDANSTFRISETTAYAPPLQVDRIEVKQLRDSNSQELKFKNGCYTDGAWYCGCGLQAKWYTSKANATKGQKCLRCPKPRDTDCGFFLWEKDDVKTRISQNQLPTLRWNPFAVLNIITASNNISCAGITKKGLPCHWNLSEDTKIQARHLLTSMAERSPREALNVLPELAQLCLCQRYHQQQAARVVAQWTALIEAYTSSLEREHTQQTNQPVGREVIVSSMSSSSRFRTTGSSKPKLNVEEIIAELNALSIRQEEMKLMLQDAHLDDEHKKSKDGSAQTSPYQDTAYLVNPPKLSESELESKDTKYGQALFSWAARHGYASLLRFRRDKSQWENPRSSIGERREVVLNGKYTCWEAVGPALEAWRMLGPQIEAYVETLPEYGSVVSMNIYMIGRTEDTAAPKILISSEDLAARKEYRKAIIKSGIMDKYPGIGLWDGLWDGGRLPSLL